MSRSDAAFLALVITQAAHSAEEYAGRLWEVFPPARFVSGLISSNLERGFLIANVCIVVFGFWCVFVPVRRRWDSASAFMWAWVVIETFNGIGHPAWSIMQGGYTPGVATAPLLLAIALYLARQLLQPHVVEEDS